MKEVLENFWIITENNKLTIHRTRKSLLRRRREMVVSFLFTAIFIALILFVIGGNKGWKFYLIVFSVIVLIFILTSFRHFFEKGFCIEKLSEGF